MDAESINCEMCGQPSPVLNARYTYRADSPDGMPADEHVLLETEQLIECPTCGTRAQTRSEPRP